MSISNNKSKSKIVSFHLFNDFSGSPIILRTVLSGLHKMGYPTDLHTSEGGVLDDLSEEGIHLSHYFYHYSPNPFVTMKRYAWVQLHTFFYAWRYRKQKDCVFYINTLLPVGPALAGKLMGKRVVYHYHENAAAKGRVYKMLCGMMKWVASDIICVSDYQKKSFTNCTKVKVVPNAVSDDFYAMAHPNADRSFYQKTILMACSCKRYKGVTEFFNLAQSLPQYHFLLVLNETEDRINDFLSDQGLAKTSNITVLPSTEDMVPIYESVSILLNLSDKSQFIETFGMTVAEAMCFGLPCIVPTVGGISELVKEGENGFHIDSQDQEKLISRINLLLTDKDRYCSMSKAAVKRSQTYKQKYMVEAIHKILYYS